MTDANDASKAFERILDSLEGTYLAHKCRDDLIVIKAALARSAWQGIESCPKDGTYILLIGKWTNGVIAKWIKNNSAHILGSGHWLTREGGIAAYEFTHWMNLPAPPADKGE